MQKCQEGKHYLVHLTSNLCLGYYLLQAHRLVSGMQGQTKSASPWRSLSTRLQGWLSVTGTARIRSVLRSMRWLRLWRKWPMGRAPGQTSCGDTQHIPPWPPMRKKLQKPEGYSRRVFHGRVNRNANTALPCNPSPVFPSRMVFICSLSIFILYLTCSSRVIKRKSRVHIFFWSDWYCSNLSCELSYPTIEVFLDILSCVAEPKLSITANYIILLDIYNQIKYVRWHKQAKTTKIPYQTKSVF